MSFVSLSVFRSVVRSIRSRVAMSIARFVLESTDDSPKMQLMKTKLMADEVRTDVERFQNYGFTSHPQDGAEGVVIFPNGERAHGLIVAVDDRRFRLVKMAKGEVAMYTDEGDKIHFKRGNIIDVETKTLNIIATDSVNINTKDYNLTATGNITEIGVGKTQTLSGNKSVAVVGNKSLSAANNTENITTLRTINVPNSLHQTLITSPIINVAALIFAGGAGTGTGDFELNGKFETINGKKIIADGNVESNASIEASANIKDSIGTLANFRSKYNIHTHVSAGFGNTSSGPTPTDP